MGIQLLDGPEADPLFQEVEDFVNCERVLAETGKTCYLSCVLLALNACKRFVLCFLMMDPFPHEPKTLSYALRRFMSDFRRLE